ncbi:VOC family protein [Streptoalloteichus hindustanus]|uniref:Catechol 2,3-dioxygenase n=1 Tax=Streptoalloteichus hindustanus TaxID=2017 RepID=A0A1M5B4M6_STRHI|nr:VOC family protein [Streptoalloteichus hindustanus]SHF37398.1 Catechol 2,3-dioxygenase [Streptoalloteichus hindustanus]
MITRLSHAPVWVLDQDSAKRFYTKVLGFEVRHDATMDGLRWLTVGPKGQPDLELILAKPAPPMVDEATAEQMRTLVGKGVLGAGAFSTEDCRAAVEELRAKGVTILQEPAERPYGVEAVFRDDSGNWFSLTEARR